jgi:hypothetical protein
VRTILLTVSFAILSPVAFAGMQTYTLPNFRTADRQVTCGYDAQAVADDFNAETGKEIVQVSCTRRDPSDDHLDAVITYLADAPIFITTTRDESGSVMNEHGVFENLSDCQADVNRQLTQFAEATGLRPLVNYCYELLCGHYALQIDAVGESAIRPLTTGAQMLDQFVDPAADLVDELKTSVENRGIKVRGVGITGWNMNYRLTLLYYGKRRLDLNGFSDITFGNLEQCHNQKARLHEIFQGYDVAPVAAACMGSYGTLRLYIFTLGPDMFNINGFNHMELPGSYLTETACMSDIARVSDIVASEERVIGAICSGKDDDFKMQFFTERTKPGRDE